MENWFHSILEHLYDNYEFDNKTVVLNDFFKTEFKIPNADSVRLMLLRDIIDTLKEKGFIAYSLKCIDGRQFHLPSLGTSVDGINFNLDNVEIKIKLTLDGYDYIEKLERNKKTYNATTRINKWFWVTIGVAIIGALISLGNFIINYRGETRLSLKASQDNIIQLQRLQLLQKDSLLNRDSLMIDTFKKINRTYIKGSHQDIR
jgi:hypothetical protein